jgi:hypothetical protein
MTRRLRSEGGTAQEPDRCQIEHGRELLQAQPLPQPSEWSGQARCPQCQAQPLRVGQDGGDEGANHSLPEAAVARLLDVGASVIDEVHVVDAARTGGHAGETGQAAVDVVLHLGACRAVVLEHVFHQIDTPARAVALVAQEHIGGASGGAETAVHAAAQDLVDLGRAWVLKLLAREARVHASRP